MKKKTTIVTEEFNDDGTLKSKITETTEEEDAGFIYPQNYQNYPWYPSTGNPITCNTYTTCDTSNK